jgi:hypothetical protein
MVEHVLESAGLGEGVGTRLRRRCERAEGVRPKRIEIPHRQELRGGPARQ